MVYDVSNSRSFQNIQSWLEESRVNGHAKMSYILIGNKADLQHTYRPLFTFQSKS